MIGCAPLELSALELEDFSLKHTKKDSVSIRNNGRGKTMELPYFSDKEGSHTCSCKGMFKSQKMVVLGEPIHHNKHCINPGRPRETFHKSIDTSLVLSTLGWGGEWLKETHWFQRGRLLSLTHLA